MLPIRSLLRQTLQDDLAVRFDHAPKSMRADSSGSVEIQLDKKGEASATPLLGRLQCFGACATEGHSRTFRQHLGGFGGARLLRVHGKGRRGANTGHGRQHCACSKNQTSKISLDHKHCLAIYSRVEDRQPRGPRGVLAIGLESPDLRPACRKWYRRPHRLKLQRRRETCLVRSHTGRLPGYRATDFTNHQKFVGRELGKVYLTGPDAATHGSIVLVIVSPVGQRRGMSRDCGDKGECDKD